MQIAALLVLSRGKTRTIVDAVEACKLEQGQNGALHGLRPYLISECLGLREVFRETLRVFWKTLRGSPSLNAQEAGESISECLRQAGDAFSRVEAVLHAGRPAGVSQGGAGELVGEFEQALEEIRQMKSILLSKWPWLGPDQAASAGPSFEVVDYREEGESLEALGEGTPRKPRRTLPSGL